MTLKQRAARNLALAAAIVLAGCVAQPQTVAVTAPPWPELETGTAATQLVVTVPLGDVDAGADLRDRLRRDYGVDVVAEWPLDLVALYCFVFEVPAERSRQEIADRMAADGRIVTVQPMNTFSVLSDDAPENLADLQHGLRDVRAFDAHAIATGRGVTVGLVDTGVDGGHRDLVGRVTRARDFVDPDPEPVDPEVHGTALAGIIGASAADLSGIAGVAPEAEIWGLRACWQVVGSRTGACNSFTLARAIHFAVANGVDVLNLSLQGPDDPLLETLIRAAQDQGVLVVAALNAPDPGFPATMDGVIAAVDPLETREAPAVRSLDGVVPAPGTDILAPVPVDSYDFFSGSSLAAAHVSGVAALMLERAPALTAAQAATLMRESAAPQAAGAEPARVVDACDALLALFETHAELVDRRSIRADTCRQPIRPSEG